VHYESPPFEYGQLVSVYHVRSIEKFRLSLLADEKGELKSVISLILSYLANCIDIFMTHDWPVGITKFGDEEQLLRFKPYFKKDIDNNQLGNPHSRELMDEIRPRYWFSGHMHAKFEATVDRKENGQTSFLALNKYQPKGKTQFFFDVSFFISISSLFLGPKDPSRFVFVK
jgi:lariat debranching enzyme